VSKLLNKLVGERDWSAQEVSHILLGLPMQDSSRDVVTLDCRPEEVRNDMVTVEDETVTTKRSPLRRYQDRLTDQVNQALADITFRLVTGMELEDMDDTAHCTSTSHQLLSTILK
jgi:hypothetical protein